MSRKAVAYLQGDASVTGQVNFSQKNPDQPVLVQATFWNLPKGYHGFHIHEFGDLSDGCMSAGSHFNPFGKRHGGPGMKERHCGDFGNVVSQGDHETTLEIVDDSITLYGDLSIIGRSVVVHKDEDDLGLGNHEDSGTTGHSGARIDCGIINPLP